MIDREPYLLKININRLDPAAHLTENGFDVGNLISRISSRTLPTQMPFDLGSSILYRLYDEFQESSTFVNPLIVQRVFSFSIGCEYRVEFLTERTDKGRSVALSQVIEGFMTSFDEQIAETLDNPNSKFRVMVGNQRRMAAIAAGYEGDLNCVVWAGDKSGFSYQDIFDKFYTEISGFISAPRKDVQLGQEL